MVIFFVLCLFFVPRGGSQPPSVDCSLLPSNCPVGFEVVLPFKTKRQQKIYLYIYKVEGFWVLIFLFCWGSWYFVVCFVCLYFFAFGCIFWLTFMFHFKQLAVESKTLAY